MGLIEVSIKDNKFPMHRRLLGNAVSLAETI
jgi:hypothetical protein